MAIPYLLHIENILKFFRFSCEQFRYDELAWMLLGRTAMLEYLEIEMVYEAIR